jgi:hypothetical protein
VENNSRNHLYKVLGEEVVQWEEGSLLDKDLLSKILDLRHQQERQERDLHKHNLARPLLGPQIHPHLKFLGVVRHDHHFHMLSNAGRHCQHIGKGSLHFGFADSKRTVTKSIASQFRNNCLDKSLISQLLAQISSMLL